MNRLLISPDDYKGYTITTCTTTPDGSLFTDVLADLGVTSIRMDATAGKYSGSTVVDFPPRSVLSMRLVLQNQVDGTTIPLRSLSLTQRSYQAGATLTSTPQTAPTGQVLFAVDQNVFGPYVSLDRGAFLAGTTYFPRARETGDPPIFPSPGATGPRSAQDPV